MADVRHGIEIFVEGEDQLTPALSKSMKSLESFDKAVAGTQTELDGLGKTKSALPIQEPKRATANFNELGTTATISGAAITAALGLATRAALRFNTAMAEVSTLVDTNTTDMGKLTDQVRELSVEYGSMPVETSKALYQTISAGFSDAADSTTLLEGALKLARGGITTTTVAVDGLTSIMNAYGLKANQVTSVSDAMFVAMKAGKTTIGELSANIGQIAGVSSQVGVGMDEMLGGISALTLGGLSTSRATTYLKGALTAVLKPTKEASDLAEKLGLDFTTASLKTKGLAGFLADLKEKTGGSDTALATLFGNVEGLSAIMGLVGNQADDFASIMEKMGMKTGETDTAFSKMNKDAQAGFDKAQASLSVFTEIMGNALLPTVGSLASQFANLLKNLSAFASEHPTLTKVVTIVTALAGATLLLGGTAVIAYAKYTAAVAATKVAMAALTLQTALATGGILLAVGAIAWFIANMNDTESAAYGIKTAFVDAFTDAGVFIGFMLGFIVGATEQAIDNITNYFENLTADKALTDLKDAFWSTFNWIRDIVKDVISDIVDLFKTFADSSIGKALMQALGNGISDGTGPMLAQVDRAMQQVDDRTPHSDAKTGPLSNLTASGEALLTTFSDGISKTVDAPANAIEPALQNLTPSKKGQAGVSGGGGGVVVNLKVDVNVDGDIGDDLEKFERKLSEVLRRIAVQTGTVIQEQVA